MNRGSRYWINKNRRGINLQNLAYKTRGKVLQQLESDTNVALVCQLFYTNRNQKKLDYCDNKVFADINIDIEYPEKFRRKARRLGYSSIETDAGYNFFCLTYPSKVIDERFFKAFDRLTKKRLVFGAFFNPYFER
ncbi:MAG: hypothetical protein RIR11_4493 [Bacteroidota bacterium]|jgi:hypothetical protein